MRLGLLAIGAFALQACATLSANSNGYETNTIYDATGSEVVRLESIVSAIPAGSVIVVTESHGFEPHHQNQRKFLEALVAAGAPSVSVGLEFFERRHQTLVDDWVQKRISEVDFLKSIEWGKTPFDHYRDQALFPRFTGGRTLALNASRALTSRIAKVGMKGLNSDERAQLPPALAKSLELVANPAYRERFEQAMKGHSTPSIDRYFQAQCAWDEMMAWTAAEHLARYSRDRLMIVVGDFHAAYGGGLPARLRAMGVPTYVISQVDLTGVSRREADALIKPHPTWGPRADWIWISQK